MSPSAEVSLGELTSDLEARLGEVALDVSEAYGQLTLKVASDDRPRALATLKSLGFTYYSYCCGVDWPEEERLEVLDHVQSPQTSVQVTVRCDVPRSSPRLPSATAVYAGADWHEREAWELFGIVFVGHPGLRRLLLPDWHEGFPMRKDELLAAREAKPWPGDFFSG